MTLLTHDQAHRYLHAAADGQLGAREQAELDAHLAVCPECHAYAAELEELHVAITRVLHSRWGKTRLSHDATQEVLKQFRRMSMRQRAYAAARSFAGASILLVLLALLAGLIRGYATQGTTPASTSDSPAFATMPAPIRGDLIAFVHYGNPRVKVSADIYMMHPDGTNQTNITRSPANYYALAWSPDGQRLAFISDRTGKPEIFVMKPDGSDVIQLSRGIEDYSYFEDLSWSPDGRYIVTLARFMNPSSTLQQIAIFRSDASGDWQLISELPSDSGQPVLAQGNNLSILPRSPDGAPQWSPDGKRIAFIGGHPNSVYEEPCGAAAGVSTSLYLIQPDGAGLVNLTRDDKSDVNAFAWSPDGTSLAYLAMRPLSDRCHVDLKLVNVDGSEPMTIFEMDGLGYQLYGNALKWSPDRTHLLFTLIHNGPPAQNRLLYLFDLDRLKLTPLPNILDKQVLIDTGIILGYSTPGWSPDGKWIIYSVLGAGDDIFKLRVDAVEATPDKLKPIQLTFSNGREDTDAQWQPMISTVGK